MSKAMPDKATETTFMFLESKQEIRASKRYDFLVEKGTIL
jgi:hypothetical protein